MARAAAEKEDAILRLREALAAWVLREVSLHADSYPDSAIRSDVVAAVQEAVEAAIDAKIQAFSEARSEIVAEGLRQEALAAFERLDTLFQARLNDMEEAWRDAAEKHLAAAETSIQEAVLRQSEDRLNRLVADHARKLEKALRGVVVDVQKGRPVDPEPSLPEPPPLQAGGDQDSGDDTRRPRGREFWPWASGLLGRLKGWRGLTISLTVLVLVLVLVVGAGIWQCTRRPSPPSTEAQAEATTHDRESSAEQLSRMTANTDARQGGNTADDEGGAEPPSDRTGTTEDEAERSDSTFDASDSPLREAGGSGATGRADQVAEATQ